MNQERRNKIQKTIDLLDDVITDEQDAYDNMPENLQETTKGDAIQTALDELQDAKDILEEIVS